MGIRRSYQFNCPGSTRNDGLNLSHACDIHGKSNTGATPFMLDCSANNRCELGDYSGYKTSSNYSFPVRIVGGLEGRHRTINTNDNITADDFNILADATGGNITLTLPLISTVPGKLLFIRTITTNTNSVFITRNAAPDTVDGMTTDELLTAGSFYLFADSTNNIWRTVSRNTKGNFMRNTSISPSITTTSASFADIVLSTSLYWTGRPVLFLLWATNSDVNGSNEFHKIEYTARWDSGGSDYLLGYTVSNIANEHHTCAGLRYLVPPSPGLHTIALRWRRQSGAGTMTMDANDGYDFTWIELN